MLQRHGVVPYAWALDALWAPSGAAAIFVAADSPALRLQALRDDIVLPVDVSGGSENRLKKTAAGPPRPFTFRCASTATVWALAPSGAGECIAGVTSDGRLELVREVRRRINSRRHQRYLEGQVLAHLEQVPEVNHEPLHQSSAQGERTAAAPHPGGAPLAALDGSQLSEAQASEGLVHVALGAAVDPPRPGPSLPGPRAALRCVAWNSKRAAAAHGDWIACGGGAGLLLILPAPTGTAANTTRPTAASDGDKEAESTNEESAED